MSKIASMTIGLVLIFVGIQLFMVKSFLLTPTATSFLAEHFHQNSDSRFANPGIIPGGNNLTNGQSASGWPFYQASQSTAVGVPAGFASLGSVTPPGYRHRLVPPKWVTWPALFVGVVFFLHGLALRR